MSCPSVGPDEAIPDRLSRPDAAHVAAATRLIEHSYMKMARMDALVSRLIRADPELEARLTAVRTEAVRAARRTLECCPEG
jgi:hypothetical protein